MTKATKAKKAGARAPGHVANLEAAAAAREAKVGKTIRLRAITRGYYGLAGVAADIREPGDVFSFAVKSLEPYKPGRYADGTERRSVTVDGQQYALPSWCEDPEAAPVDAVDAVDDDEAEADALGAVSANSDVI